MHRLRLATAVIFALAGCSNLAGVPAGGPATAGRFSGGTLRPYGSGVPVAVGGCSIFPADNWWNTDISKYPVDERSDRYIKSIPGDLHPDFGHNPAYGIPFDVVPRSQKKVKVTFDYFSQSDPGPYPIPPNPQIEGGRHSTGDRHLLVLQVGAASSTKCGARFRKITESDGTQDRARSFHSTPINCAPTAGPRPTQRGSRSCPH